VAQHRKEEPADTLEELASLGERLVQWVGANPTPVLAMAVLILVIAAGIGGYRAFAGSRSERASAQLAALHDELVQAMGGKPTDTEIPEPANPETARTVRTDFAERYATLANQWSGTPAGALAMLEAGRLYEQLGNQDRALEVWLAAAQKLPSDSAALGILRTRIAGIQEAKGDLEGAAKSYEAAASVTGFPLVASALADAARCWAETGKSEPALAAYRRLKTEFPEYQVPPYVESQVQELELRSGAPVAATPPTPPAPQTP
jgi:tetratricopeptide (TPR) repeat protein